MLTTWLPMQSGEQGGMFIRWLYGESEASILQAVSKIPAAGWELSDLTFSVGTQPLYLFDAAYSGMDVINGEEHLTVELDKGNHSIQTAVYEPNGELYIVLHHFKAID